MNTSTTTTHDRVIVSHDLASGRFIVRQGPFLRAVGEYATEAEARAARERILAAASI